MIKQILLPACFMLSLNSLSQKKPLDHSVYDNWQSIGERLLANNGKFVAYTITPQEGDAILVLQQTDGKKTVGSAPGV